MTQCLDGYHFYEESWNSYDELCNEFEWEVPERFNLATYLCDQWATEKNRVALFAETSAGSESAYTFWQLRNHANRLANHLEDLGVERGDRVALTAPQRAETLITNLAAWKIGAVSVPLAPQFGPDALKYRLSDCDARICIVDSSNVDTIHEVRDDLENLEHVIVMDEVNDDERDVSSEALFWEVIRTADRDYETVKTDADKDAVIVYTSGTTGNPKGVRTPHRLLLGLLPGFITIHCNLQVDDDHLWRTPAGWGWMVFFVGMANLFYGKPVLAYDGRYDPETELHLIEKYGVTNWFAPPTVIRMMMNQVDDPGCYDVNSVRTIPTGGEAVGQSIVDWADATFGDVTINEAYGQSEALLTLGECGSLLESREGKMGRAVPGHDVDIVDVETADSVSSGEVGEIAVRHEDNPVVFNGYWDMPEKTDVKFANEWLLTEDLGIKDEDGYIGFHSRKDDVIICSGYRVGPEELEEKLSNHESVADCGVIGVPDETRGNVPKAFIQLVNGVEGAITMKEELQEFIKSRLAPYEYPREIEFVDTLPKTPVSGKIQRAELRERESL